MIAAQRYVKMNLLELIDLKEPFCNDSYLLSLDLIGSEHLQGLTKIKKAMLNLNKTI